MRAWKAELNINELNDIKSLKDWKGLKAAKLNDIKLNIKFLFSISCLTSYVF